MNKIRRRLLDGPAYEASAVAESARQVAEGKRSFENHVMPVVKNRVLTISHVRDAYDRACELVLGDTGGRPSPTFESVPKVKDLVVLHEDGGDVWVA